jgi:hypothetical protein
VWFVSSGDCPQQGGFARTVGTDERNGLTLRHLERDAAYSLEQAVAAIEIFGSKKGHEPVPR